MTTMTKTKTVADKYQRKTQHEHILDRPNTYIGSIDLRDENLFIYNDEINKITKKNMQFCSWFKSYIRRSIIKCLRSNCKRWNWHNSN